jgi:hypothetical protein
MTLQVPLPIQGVRLREDRPGWDRWYINPQFTALSGDIDLGAGLLIVDSQHPSTAVPIDLHNH